MANKNLTKSNPSAAFFCLHVIPFGSAVRWIQIFIGPQCRATFIVNGGSYDKIIWTEKFNEGMADVLSSIKTPHSVDLETIPRFNESEGHGPKRAHPVEDYFDDISMHLVYEIFKRDFEVFKYDFKDPSNKMPIGEIDLDEVHKKLGD